MSGSSIFKRQLSLAFRNIFRNRRRTLITIISIISGYVGLILLCAYVARVERYLMVNTVYMGQSGHISIYKTDAIDKYVARPGKYILSGSDIEKVRQTLSSLTEDIEFQAPYILATGLVQSEGISTPFMAKGFDQASFEFTRNHPMVQRWTAELRDLESVRNIFSNDQENQLALTNAIEKKIKSKEQVVLLAESVDRSLSALDAQVAAKFSTGLALTEDTSIQAPIRVLRSLLATDGATYLGYYLRDDQKTKSMVKKVNQIFQEQNLDYKAYPYFDERIGLFYTGTVNFLYAMAGFFLLLVSAVIILSVANSVSMNVIERTRELGTLLAICFKKTDVARIIELEALISSAAAIFIGYILSQLISVFVNSLNIRFRPPGIANDMQFALSPWTSICVALAVPMLILSWLTAKIVVKRKLKKSVANLLTETTG